MVVVDQKELFSARMINKGSKKYFYGFVSCNEVVKRAFMSCNNLPEPPTMAIFHIRKFIFGST